MTDSADISDVLEAQSLARGLAGRVLLAAERVRRGLDDPTQLHALLSRCVRDLAVDDDACLYVGAPAAAYAVHSAAAPGEHRATLAALDEQTIQITRRRLTAAHDRIDRGERPALAEYDLFHGLTGLGAHLLHRHPEHPVVRDVVRYLVRLTRPLARDPYRRPGWWVHHAPTGRASREFACGHANLGIAHGITGPLSLLALAARRDVLVDGQHDAIRRVLHVLDESRVDDATGSWWPHWLTPDGPHPAATTGPPRPSWCYGTPAHARAQQLAALALGDHARREHAETALLRCLDYTPSLALLTDVGLCHGIAGLIQTVRRVRDDAPQDTATRLDTRLAELLPILDTQTAADTGFLDGTTGADLVRLTTHSRRHERPSSTHPDDWDVCLLLR